MKALLAAFLLLSTPVFAQADIDLTEGKIAAAESLWMKDLEKGVNEKQQKAMALLTLVANKANDRYSSNDDSLREQAEYAHVGFAARLQGIREERETLARKEIQPDYATLQNYSKRLDSLIKDLQDFLK